MPPRATMRLQLHKGFTFADAARLAPYMARLGVSHLYASPILAARAGSMHGYDVVDPTRVNPELSGEDGFRALVAALRAEGLGLIIDIVPNHMAVGGENPWWCDVLRLGRASAHADVFDIDWDALCGKILLPVLGKPYGDALDDIRIKDDTVHYFDNRFPLRPEDAGADPIGREQLHHLLERQHYRLAWWRTAGDEINWRRFFDINELAGVRVEVPRVFEAVHATLFRLYAEGLIDGMRVDHVDGLADPRAYCLRLRTRLAELRSDIRPYIVVEKILGVGESLPAEWQVDGTSGYDFMNDVSAVQHDDAAAEALSALWASLSGGSATFPPEEVAARREILDLGFAGQLDSCIAALHVVARQDLATRDITSAAIRRAVIALLAHFPAYRGYSAREHHAPGDPALYARALDGDLGTARPEVMQRIVAWLCAPDSPARAIAARRFQQLSAPVAAKAVEDTAFYRYGRLLSRNDVGFDAARLGIGAAEFHRRAHARGTQYPGALLATATHDHKRGEDVRARLAVLSECPEEWAATLRRWMARCRSDAPSPRDAVMLYQMIVGAWPTSLAATDKDGRRAFAERLAGWQEKALREAKLRTSWTAPDEAYETAAREFLMASLEDDAFAAEAVAFVDRIAPAGAVNGLVQAVLKLTVPGVPDFYQGTEFWNQSLVDPDNRRPVDFAARIATLEADEAPAVLAPSWRDGRVKQAMVARVLTLRRRQPALFAEGEYVRLATEGPEAARVIALARRNADAVALVAVPRLPFGLGARPDLSVPREAWRCTRLTLPDWLIGWVMRDVLGGGEHRLGATLELGELLARLPIAVLA